MKTENTKVKLIQSIKSLILKQNCIYHDPGMHSNVSFSKSTKRFKQNKNETVPMKTVL